LTGMEIIDVDCLRKDGYIILTMIAMNTPTIVYNGHYLHNITTLQVTSTLIDRDDLK